MNAFHIFQAKVKLPVIPLTCLILFIITSCNKYENDDNYKDLIGMQGRESSAMGSEIFYGPEKFTIVSKEYVNETRILGSAEIQYYENFVLTVQNGNSGRTKVTKLEILVDDVVVLSYRDFRKNLNIVSKPLVGLTEGSVMKVKLEGSGGRFISVSIECSVKENMISDIDGNFYKTVKIGNQWWMAENLRTTKFNDGIAIPEIPDATEWLNMSENHISAYCWYDNKASNKIPYGALYNWESAGDDRICPDGWHLPDSHEYYELCLFLDQNSILGVFSDIAGGMLKEAGTKHWQDPNTGATNSSGFTALPGGIRDVMGSFSNFGATASFWSDKGLSSCSLSYNNTYASFSEGGNEYGRSIRCVKD